MIGGFRRILLAAGLACLAGGYGTCIDLNFHRTDGPDWMTLGGLLVGLVLPLPRKK